MIQNESAFKMDEKMKLYQSKSSLTHGQPRTRMSLHGVAAVLSLLSLAAPAMAIDFGP